VARNKKRNQRHALLIPLSRSGYNIQTSAGRLLRGEFDYQPRIAAAQIEINLRYPLLARLKTISGLWEFWVLLVPVCYAWPSCSRLARADERCCRAL